MDLASPPSVCVMNRTMRRERSLPREQFALSGRNDQPIVERGVHHKADKIVDSYMREISGLGCGVANQSSVLLKSRV